MEIDAEPEALVAGGEEDEGIACEAPAVMGILWRVEGVLKEADTRMRDGDETS